MGYKSRYLIDDGTGATFLDAESGAVTLTGTGTGGIAWAQDTTTAYIAVSPYRKGETGNPDGTAWSANILNSSTSYRLNGSPVTWNGFTFSVQFWFRPNSDSSTTSNMVLFSTSENSDATRSLHILQDQSNIRVTIRQSGVETELLKLTDIITDHFEGSWYFILLTYDGGDMNLYVGDNNASGIPTFPPLSNTSTIIPYSPIFDNYILGYDTITGHNQFLGAYSILRIFDDDVKDDRLNLYNLNAFDGKSYGDVHIKTLYGLSYDMHDIGYHKWFDDNNCFINVKVQYGKYKRWSKNDYVTQLYIKNDKDDILINTGFRGDPVEVINFNNKNKTISYQLEEIKFDKKAKNHCSECTFGSSDEELIKKHEKERKHHLPKMIRNMISINVKTKDNQYKITVKNINKFNVQPAIISIVPSNFYNYQSWSGYIISKNKGKRLKDIFS